MVEVVRFELTLFLLPKQVPLTKLGDTSLYFYCIIFASVATFKSSCDFQSQF